MSALTEKVAAIFPEAVLAMSREINSKECGSIPTGKATAVKISTFTNKDGVKLLDIRKYVKSERYTGFTKQGVDMPLEELNTLIFFLTQLYNNLPERKGAWTFKDLAGGA
jgi:hypothetical protein